MTPLPTSNSATANEHHLGDLRPLRRRPKVTPLQQREVTRTNIAHLLVGLLALVILALIAALVFAELQVAGIKDLSAAFVTPLIGLVGAVTGYYYGSGAADASQDAV